MYLIKQQKNCFFMLYSLILLLSMNAHAGDGAYTTSATKVYATTEKDLVGVFKVTGTQVGDPGYFTVYEPYVNSKYTHIEFNKIPGDGAALEYRVNGGYYSHLNEGQTSSGRYTIKTQYRKSGYSRVRNITWRFYVTGTKEVPKFSDISFKAYSDKVTEFKLVYSASGFDNKYDVTVQDESNSARYENGYLYFDPRGKYDHLDYGVDETAKPAVFTVTEKSTGLSTTFEMAPVVRGAARNVSVNVTLPRHTQAIIKLPKIDSVDYSPKSFRGLTINSNAIATMNADDILKYYGNDYTFLLSQSDKEVKFRVKISDELQESYNPTKVYGNGEIVLTGQSVLESQKQSFLEGLSQLPGSANTFIKLIDNEIVIDPSNTDFEIGTLEEIALIAPKSEEILEFQHFPGEVQYINYDLTTPITLYPVSAATQETTHEITVSDFESRKVLILDEISFKSGAYPEGKISQLNEIYSKINDLVSNQETYNSYGRLYINPYAQSEASDISREITSDEASREGGLYSVGLKLAVSMVGLKKNESFHQQFKLLVPNVDGLSQTFHTFNVEVIGTNSPVVVEENNEFDIDEWELEEGIQLIYQSVTGDDYSSYMDGEGSSICIKAVDPETSVYIDQNGSENELNIYNLYGESVLTNSIISPQGYYSELMWVTSDLHEGVSVTPENRYSYQNEGETKTLYSGVCINVDRSKFAYLNIDDNQKIPVTIDFTDISGQITNYHIDLNIKGHGVTGTGNGSADNESLVIMSPLQNESTKSYLRELDKDPENRELPQFITVSGSGATNKKVLVYLFDDRLKTSLHKQEVTVNADGDWQLEIPWTEGDPLFEYNHPVASCAIYKDYNLSFNIDLSEKEKQQAYEAYQSKLDYKPETNQVLYYSKELVIKNDLGELITVNAKMSVSDYSCDFTEMSLMDFSGGLYRNGSLEVLDKVFLNSEYSDNEIEFSPFVSGEGALTGVGTEYVSVYVLPTSEGPVEIDGELIFPGYKKSLGRQSIYRYGQETLNSLSSPRRLSVDVSSVKSAGYLDEDTSLPDQYSASIVVSLDPPEGSTSYTYSAESIPIEIVFWNEIMPVELKINGEKVEQADLVEMTAPGGFDWPVHIEAPLIIPPYELMQFKDSYVATKKPDQSKCLFTTDQAKLTEYNRIINENDGLEIFTQPVCEDKGWASIPDSSVIQGGSVKGSATILEDQYLDYKTTYDESDSYWEAEFTVVPFEINTLSFSLSQNTIVRIVEDIQISLEQQSDNMNNCVFTNDKNEAISDAKNNDISDLKQPCLFEWVYLPVGIQADEKMFDLYGKIETLGDHTVSWRVSTFDKDGEQVVLTEQSEAISAVDPELPAPSFDAYFDMDTESNSIYVPQDGGRFVSLRIDDVKASIVVDITKNGELLETENLTIKGGKERNFNRTYVIDEGLALGTVTEYSVRLYFSDIPEVESVTTFKVITVPNKSVIPLIFSDDNEVLNIENFEVSVRMRSSYNAKAEFDSNLIGDWKIRLINSQRSGESTLTDWVKMDGNGEVDFNIDISEIESRSVRIYAEALYIGLGFDGGEDFIRRSNTPFFLKVLDGTSIEAGVISSRMSGQIPFKSVLQVKTDTSQKRGVVGDIYWLTSSDNESWVETLKPASDRKRFEWINSFTDEEVLYVKAKLINIHSGIESETETVKVVAYNSPEIEINGPKVIFSDDIGSYSALLYFKQKDRSKNFLEDISKYTIQWSLDGGISYTESGDVIEINANEYTDVKRVKLKAKVRPIIAFEDDRRAYNDEQLSVSIQGVKAPKVYIDGDRRIETGVVSTFTVETLLPYRGMVGEIEGQWVLPNGDLDYGESINYTPTAADLKAGTVEIQYQAWIKGFKQEGGIETESYRIRVWEYIWPEWVIVDRARSYEAPSEIAIITKPISYSGRIKNAEFSWDIPEGIEIIKERGGAEKSLRFLEPGNYTIKIKINDDRDNVTEISKNYTIVKPQNWVGSIEIKGDNKYQRAPLGILVRPLISGGHEKDRVETLTYTYDGIQGEASKSRYGRAVLDAGEHTVRLEMVSEYGKTLVIEGTIQVKENIEPQCRIESKDRGTSYLMDAVCTDEDGRVVDYEWMVNEQIVNSSYKRISISKTGISEEPMVEVVGIDDAGGRSETARN